eukprot:1176015-Prorocentrum_minimum.AAC.3
MGCTQNAPADAARRFRKFGRPTVLTSATAEGAQAAVVAEAATAVAAARPEAAKEKVLAQGCDTCESHRARRTPLQLQVR